MHSLRYFLLHAPAPKRTSWASLNIKENHPNNTMFSWNTSTELVHNLRIKLEKVIQILFLLSISPLLPHVCFTQLLGFTFSHAERITRIFKSQISHPYLLQAGGGVFTIPIRSGRLENKISAVHYWDNTV